MFGPRSARCLSGIGQGHVRSSRSFQHNVSEGKGSSPMAGPAAPGPAGAAAALACTWVFLGLVAPLGDPAGPHPRGPRVCPHTGVAFGAVAPPAATASAVAPPGCGLAVVCGWSGGGLAVVWGFVWGWSGGGLGVVWVWSGVAWVWSGVAGVGPGVSHWYARGVPGVGPGSARSQSGGQSGVGPGSVEGVMVSAGAPPGGCIQSVFKVYSRALEYTLNTCIQGVFKGP